MTLKVAYLGPPGTYSEMAALTYYRVLQENSQETITLEPYPSIFRVLNASVEGKSDFSIVPVENSIEGGVAVTLDTLWQLEELSIQKALVLPITHALLSRAKAIQKIRVIYSHPQALAQCQQWIETHLPFAKLIPTQSTTEALHHISDNLKTAAIASERAADLYELPILAYGINDYADNCTKFWILSKQHTQNGSHTTLAFSLPVNAPGALLKPLKILAECGINLSRIESRPTKRSLGEYLFFLDIESSITNLDMQKALHNLRKCTETLKILGTYSYLQS